MENLPAPAPAPHPHTPVSREYRLELNNWLQSRGWLTRLTWNGDEKDGPDDNPTWHAACNCPFHFTPFLLDSHLYPIVDGTEYGRSKDRKLGLAREEAARRALRRLLLENVVLPLIERRQDRPSP